MAGMLRVNVAALLICEDQIKGLLHNDETTRMLIGCVPVVIDRRL